MRNTLQEKIDNVKLVHYANEKYKHNVNKRIDEINNHPLKEYADYVVEKVSEKTGISIDNLKGNKRFPDFVAARYMAVSIIGDNTDFKEYSMIFVNKDRSTYYHMVENIDSLLHAKNMQKLFIELKSLCSLSTYNNVDKKV